MKMYLKIAALLIFVIGVFQSTYSNGKEYTSLSEFGVKIGGKFPLENLTYPDGKSIPTGNILGKPVLIKFYTKYCTPCIK